MSVNGDCPKCGKPFPLSRKRCWSCSPGGKLKNMNGAATRASVLATIQPDPPASDVAEIEERKAALKSDHRERCGTAVHQVDRIEVMRRAMEAKAKQDREAALLERKAPVPPVPAPPVPEREKAIVVSTVDLEMSTLVAVVDALRRLDPEAQGRILGYVNSRFNFTKDSP